MFGGSTRFPDLPTLDEFIEQNLGAWSNPVTKPAIAFEDFRRDPEKFPLNTPSGKIEIFSKQLYDFGKPDEVPPIPEIHSGMGKPIQKMERE